MIKLSVSIFGQTAYIGFIPRVESQSDYQDFNIQCLVFNNILCIVNSIRCTSLHRNRN